MITLNDEHADSLIDDRVGEYTRPVSRPVSNGCFEEAQFAKGVVVDGLLSTEDATEHPHQEATPWYRRYLFSMGRIGGVTVKIGELAERAGVSVQTVRYVVDWIVEAVHAEEHSGEMDS